ncbi:MAG: UDP-N-acetylglucosamine 2-epimerase (non-hydrolyzing) [Bacteroidia bacterium]|nr:UDP-N-acetylglucosamine 2-epimerase (non-hydrolyzing) [Bacteroidia bacterium]
MSTKIKLMSLVGARPQFIKLAPLVKAIEVFNEGSSSTQVDHYIIHTGQHYDHGMSDIFFDELEIPHPDINLGVGSGPHGVQTGKMLEGIEKILMDEKPDMLVIFGDTNSTIAGALAAAKLHIPIAHIEAGLRSFNRKMPEEVNRIMSDHVSDLLLAPTPTAIANLKNEGLESRTISSGDIMYDTVMLNSKLAEKKSTILEKLNLEKGSYAIATCHRAENTNDPQRLTHIMNSFNKIATEHLPVVFPMHPRTKHILPNVLPDWKAAENLIILEPLGYLDMVQLIGGAKMALTDSGGLQKEAFFLECPCVTMRDETEWTETVEAGGNIITGADPEKIMNAVQHWEKMTAQGHTFTEKLQETFGEGKSADITIIEIIKFLESKEMIPA